MRQHTAGVNRAYPDKRYRRCSPQRTVVNGAGEFEGDEMQF